MRPEARRIHWRTTLVGMAIFALLGGLWILLPTRAPARERVAMDVLDALHGALSRDDRAALVRCRETLRRNIHRDLAGRTLPGILRLVDALLKVDRTCDSSVADAFDRGVCAIRQGRYGDALLELGGLPDERGAAALGEVAARLLRLQNEEPRARERITSAVGRRSIPARFVPRRLNTPKYSSSSRLACRAPRRPRCFELILPRALTQSRAGFGPEAK